MEKLLRWTSADLLQGETLALKFWSHGLHLKGLGLLLLDGIFLEFYCLESGLKVDKTFWGWKRCKVDSQLSSWWNPRFLNWWVYLRWYEFFCWLTTFDDLLRRVDWWKLVLICANQSFDQAICKDFPLVLYSTFLRLVQGQGCRYKVDSFPSINSSLLEGFFA